MEKSSQLGRIGWKQAVLAIPPCIAAVANFSGTRESGWGTAEAECCNVSRAGMYLWWID
jgi:hypothetical protein